MATRKCRYGRKKSGACKRKPGPKKSSRKRCKRGRRKGTRSCRRKPGPKKSKRSRRRRSRFKMQSGPNTAHKQWGCSKYLKKPCNQKPWCKYVTGKGCIKNNDYRLAKGSSNPFASSSSNPFASGSSIPKPGYTPCAVDRRLPKGRKKSLCNADPNCTWTGEFCKFQPRRLPGTSRLTQYGDYQGPMNLLPEYRPVDKNPGPSMSRIVAKENWKKATRAAKEDMRKRRKEERKAKERRKEANKALERILKKEKKRKDANPFAQTRSYPSNPFEDEKSPKSKSNNPFF